MSERDPNYHVPYYEPTSNQSTDAWQRPYGQVEADHWQSECNPHLARQSIGRIPTTVTSQVSLNKSYYYSFLFLVTSRKNCYAERE